MSVNSHSSAAAEPRKRPRQRRSEETVARILDTAARIFDERGYRATTTNHVAEGAGVSIGSLYQYFPNKDALLTGLAERHLAEALPRMVELGEWLDRTEPGPDELARRIVEESLRLNDQPLHQLLYDGPRTDEVNARLATFDEFAVEVLTRHYRRFGHPESVAEARARLTVIAVDAVVHHADGRRPVVQEEAVGMVARLARTS